MQPVPLSAKQRVKTFLYGMSLRTVDRDGASDCFKAAIFGQWEGDEHNRLRNRPGRRTAGQDTDLNYGVREDLLSEARSLQQTYPIAKRIKNQYAEYCVGKCGLRWPDVDPDIAEIYRQNWNDWMPACDYAARHSFPKLMKIAVEESFGVGDIFFQKIGGKDLDFINGIEADRVSSSGIFNFDTDQMVGGIGIDPATKRAKFIRTWQRTIYGTFVNPLEIPSSDYCHLFDSSRIDAMRGVTAYYAVLDATRDAKEIGDAERAKTKRNSKLALIAKLLTGPARAKVNLGFGKQEEEKQNGVTVERAADGSTIYLYPGENIQAHESASPGAAWQGHMEYLVRMISIGCNLPFGVVWNMANLGKPGVLFELEQAARTFSSFQDQLDFRLIRPIATWKLGRDIARKKVPFHPNWYKFTIGRPAYISIDAGRDSIAAQNENKLGMRTLADWYDENGEYWQDQLRQCIAERKFLDDECKKMGVDPNTVRILTANGNPAGGGAGPIGHDPAQGTGAE